MDDKDKKPGEPRTGESEGVRIIGAEEAAEAIGRSDVAQRRPEDAPRYGDRPAPPPEDGPRPAIRFPLSGRGDPPVAAVEPAAVPPTDPARPRAAGDDTALPHWTDPPTGEVPRIFTNQDEEGDDLDAWSTFSSSSPRWRDSNSDYDLHDYEDVAALGSDETRIGALDDRDRPAPHDFFADEPEYEPSGQPAPTRTITSDPRRSTTGGGSRSTVERGGSGRDLPTAIGVGVGFAIVALIAFSVGPKATMVLVTAVITLASLEFFNAVRKANLQPATLLGAVGAASFVLAAYYKGEVSYPLVLFLTVVFGLLWFWLVTPERVVVNLGVTLLGIMYVGGLGSFAGLLLRTPNGAGIGLLLVAIIPTVGYDVGGFVIGRNAGRAPLTDISPNKTVEGLLGGMLVAFVTGYIAAAFIHPFASLGTLDKAWLGFVVAIAAPLGDLCESLVKRDLGVKDMGEILPGHGGMLDRFDALLFVLPSVYYLSTIVFK